MTRRVAARAACRSLDMRGAGRSKVAEVCTFCAHFIESLQAHRHIRPALAMARRCKTLLELQPSAISVGQCIF